MPWRSRPRTKEWTSGARTCEWIGWKLQSLGFLKMPIRSSRACGQRPAMRNYAHHTGRLAAVSVGVVVLRYRQRPGLSQASPRASSHRRGRRQQQFRDAPDRAWTYGQLGSAGHRGQSGRRHCPGTNRITQPPDGYTLLFAPGLPFSGSAIAQKAPYDVADFSPIALTNRSPLVQFVRLPRCRLGDPSKELIALAKARPGELNYSSGGTGGAAHLAAELFKAMAGVNIVRIAYKGGGASFIDLVAGRVQLTFAAAGELAPHLKVG